MLPSSESHENISRARKALSPRFSYYSFLMGKGYLAMQMWLCAGKLKVKTAHFRLPSASQKRVCLSLDSVGRDSCLIPLYMLKTVLLSELFQTNRDFWNKMFENIGNVPFGSFLQEVTDYS